ncbi:MAG TPA: AMP-binding protein [Aestuariivirga sp.]|nr:AMP-binding protein [Aestuariivirga sp.]
MEKKLTQGFYATLQKTPLLSRAAIEDYQRKLLEKLLRHARAQVPYYRDSGRLEVLFGADGKIDWSRWPLVPTLTRRTAQDNEDRLRAEKLPREMLPLENDMTSGSTGAPLRIARTMLSRVASRALLGRAVTWHDQGPIGRVAVSRYVKPDFVPATGGHTITLPGHWPPREQIEVLARAEVTHLITYPNLLASLLEAGGPGALKKIRVAVLTGEALGPELRQTLARQIPARLIECYSATEVGPIAYEDANHHLRVCEENVFVETGASVAGDSAEVLLTPFYAYAMPLIRYAPGDYITLSSSPSSFMPALRRIEKIAGRERNLFRNPQGALFYPFIAAKQLADILDYREWQLEQLSRQEAVFRIVCASLPTPEQIRRLEAELTRVLQGLVPTVLQVAQILRTAGKAYESVLRNPSVE